MVFLNWQIRISIDSANQMKYLILPTLLFITFIGCSQEIDSTVVSQSSNASIEKDYLMIYPNHKTASYYKYGKASYLEFFLDDKVKFGEHEYYARVRNYSWGSLDTAYFRKDETNFYHFDKITMTESLQLPRNPIVGQEWKDTDGSWSYKIIKVNQTFLTPEKEYPECILVECRQLTGKDKDKSPLYHLYYSKGYGYVGNVDSKGNVLSYLSKVVTDAKVGTVVGDYE